MITANNATLDPPPPLAKPKRLGANVCKAMQSACKFSVAFQTLAMSFSLSTCLRRCFVHTDIACLFVLQVSFDSPLSILWLTSVQLLMAVIAGKMVFIPSSIACFVVAEYCLFTLQLWFGSLSCLATMPQAAQVIMDNKDVMPIDIRHKCIVP